MPLINTLLERGVNESGLAAAPEVREISKPGLPDGFLVSL